MIASFWLENDYLKYESFIITWIHLRTLIWSGKKKVGRKSPLLFLSHFFSWRLKINFARKSCDVIFLQQQNDSQLFILIYFMLWIHCSKIVVILVLQLKWSEDAVTTLRGAVQLRAGVRPRYSSAFSQSNRRNSLQWCYRKWSCKLIVKVQFRNIFSLFSKLNLSRHKLCNSDWL